MRQSLVVSSFGFMLAFCIALMYYLLRTGFAENSVDIPLRVLSVSSFILFLPQGVSFILKFLPDPLRKVFFNDTIVSIYGLGVICIVGYCGARLGVNVSFVFVIVGCILGVVCLFRLLKSIRRVDTIGFVLAAVVLSLWIGSVCWYIVLKPFIVEGWAVGTDKIDTGFHLAIAQMIKTYGIPSTGLDGIPSMNYHWGSHWIFAQLSNFFDLPVVVIYQLAFPVIIGPLLCKTFMSFAIQVQLYFKPEEKQMKLNPFFWIISLAIFIGIAKNAAAGNSLGEYFSGGMSLTLFIFLSESYTISIILMFAIFASALHFWMKRTELNSIQQSFFLFFLFPLTMAAIGMTKISTLYVVCCVFGYLFLRLQMFRRVLFCTWLIIFVMTALAVFKLVFEPRENHGSMEWFFFYRNFNLNIPLFLLLFYLWTYFFIAVYVVRERLYKQPLKLWLFTDKSIALECVLVIAVAGFLPTMLLKIQNYDSLYFTDIQMWVSSALLLAWVPFYKLQLSLSRTMKFAIAIPCIFVFVIFYRNTKVFFMEVLGDSINTHKQLFYGEKNFGRLRVSKIRSEVNYILKGTYSEDNKVLRFLQKLGELDSLSLEEKRKTLVYVDFRTLMKKPEYDWGLYCHNLPFVVPSLSGMGMVDGIDVTYFDCVGGSCCFDIGLGYQYYPKWKTREEIDRGPTLEELQERVRQKGYFNLIVFNVQTEKFEKIARPAPPQMGN